MFKRFNSSVEIKGFGSDINIIISSSAKFSDIESDLIRRFDNNKGFFNGIDAVLDVGDRDLSYMEVQRIKSILTDRYGIRISYVKTSSEITRNAVERVGWSTERGEDVMEVNTKAAISNNDTLLIKRTLRAGQKVSHQGNVVIVGDVNPGAEVEATGDIIVFGKLRGIAHAGYSGNTEAKIIALDLRPVQLRIAGYIRRSPDREPKPAGFPEVASLLKEDGEIIVEKLKY